jgi:hypothetical protein
MNSASQNREERKEKTGGSEIPMMQKTENEEIYRLRRKAKTF